MTLQADPHQQKYQDHFSKALLDPNISTPENIVDPKGKHAPKRFSVYRNNVTHSLLEAMRQGFPTIENLIGKTLFSSR